MYEVPSLILLYVCICMHTSMHTYTHTHTHAYMHTNIHSNIHTYMHTHVYIYTLHPSPTCLSPSLATATISGVRHVRLLKNMAMILALSSPCCCVCLISDQAMAVHSSSMQAVRRRVKREDCLGLRNRPPSMVSSVSAMARASWRRVTRSEVSFRRGGRRERQ